MKLKIKIKVLNEICKPVLSETGDCIDLRASKNIKLNKGDFYYIPLGVVMQLPKGFKGVAMPRSSTFKNFKVIQSNSIGIIDQQYCGPKDEWHFPALAMRNTKINAGDRICQFEIALSQKATIWQKLKWLFSNGIKIEIVNTVSAPNRGGLGHSGIK